LPQESHPKVSIFDIVSNKELASNCTQFELKTGNEEKRIFEITAETIVLDNRSCIMLLLHEQTAQY
jgi:hypothetical protein